MTANSLYSGDSLLSSDTDDYREIPYSSSSQDRSSIGSIPWAEDAIKQNQLEWERLERMFYGEESLPSDMELRNEIQEWKKAFPHLRVNGRQFIFPQIPTRHRRHIVEEIIAIDPPPCPHFSQGIRQVKQSESQNNNTTKMNDNVHLDSVGNMIAKELRISSVPMLSRRQHVVQEQSSRNDSPLPTSKGIKSSKSLILVTKESKANHTPREILSTNSFSFILSGNSYLCPDISTVLKMPPLENVNKYNRTSLITSDTYLPQLKSIKVAPKENTYDHTVILPVIKLNGLEYFSENNGRSISAAFNQERTRTTHLPHSASKFKSFRK